MRQPKRRIIFRLLSGLLILSSGLLPSSAHAMRELSPAEGTQAAGMEEALGLSGEGSREESRTAGPFELIVSPSDRKAVAQAVRRAHHGIPGPNQLVMSTAGLNRTRSSFWMDVAGSENHQFDTVLIGRELHPSPLIPDARVLHPERTSYAADVVWAEVETLRKSRSPSVATLEALISGDTSLKTEDPGWLRSVLQAVREVLEHPVEGQTPRERLNALLEQRREQAPALQAAIQAVHVVERMQYDLNSDIQRLWEALTAASNDEGEVPAEAVRENWRMLEPYLAPWPRTHMAAHIHSRGLPEQGTIPLSGEHFYIYLLLSSVRERSRFLLLERASASDLSAVYYDATRTALLSQVPEMERQLEEAGDNPPSILQSNILRLGQLVACLEYEAAITDSLIGKMSRSFRGPEASALPLPEVGFFVVDDQGKAEFKPGGGTFTVVPLSQGGRFSPYRVRESYQPGNRIVLVFPSFTGGPSLQQIDIFLESWFYLDSVIPGHPEVWMAVASEEGELRVYRPAPLAGEHWERWDRMKDEQIYLSRPHEGFLEALKKDFLTTPAEREAVIQWWRKVTRYLEKELRSSLVAAFGEEPAANVMRMVRARHGKSLEELKGVPDFSGLVRDKVDKPFHKIGQLLPPVAHFAGVLVGEGMGAYAVDETWMFERVPIQGEVQVVTAEKRAAEVEAKIQELSSPEKVRKNRLGSTDREIETVQDFAGQWVPAQVQAGKEPEGLRFIDFKKAYERHRAELKAAQVRLQTLAEQLEADTVRLVGEARVSEDEALALLRRLNQLPPELTQERRQQLISLAEPLVQRLTQQMHYLVQVVSAWVGASYDAGWRARFPQAALNDPEAVSVLSQAMARLTQVSELLSPWPVVRSSLESNTAQLQALWIFLELGRLSQASEPQRQALREVFEQMPSVYASLDDDEMKDQLSVLADPAAQRFAQAIQTDVERNLEGIGQQDGSQAVSFLADMDAQLLEEEALLYRYPAMSRQLKAVRGRIRTAREMVDALSRVRSLTQTVGADSGSEVNQMLTYSAKLLPHLTGSGKTQLMEARRELVRRFVTNVQEESQPLLPGGTRLTTEQASELLHTISQAMGALGEFPELSELRGALSSSRQQIRQTAFLRPTSVGITAQMVLKDGAFQAVLNEDRGGVRAFLGAVSGDRFPDNVEQIRSHSERQLQRATGTRKEFYAATLALISLLQSSRVASTAPEPQTGMEETPDQGLQRLAATVRWAIDRRRPVKATIVSADLRERTATVEYVSGADRLPGYLPARMVLRGGEAEVAVPLQVSLAWLKSQEGKTLWLYPIWVHGDPLPNVLYAAGKSIRQLHEHSKPVLAELRQKQGEGTKVQIRVVGLAQRGGGAQVLYLGERGAHIGFLRIGSLFDDPNDWVSNDAKMEWLALREEKGERLEAKVEKVVHEGEPSEEFHFSTQIPVTPELFREEPVFRAEMVWRKVPGKISGFLSWMLEGGEDPSDAILEWELSPNERRRLGFGQSGEVFKWLAENQNRIAQRPDQLFDFFNSTAGRRTAPLLVRAWSAYGMAHSGPSSIPDGEKQERAGRRARRVWQNAQGAEPSLRERIQSILAGLPGIPAEPKGAGMEEVERAMAKVMEWGAAIQAGTLSRERFHEETRAFAQQPLFNQSLPLLTGDLVLRFKLRRNLEDLFWVSQVEWDSPFLRQVLGDLLTDLTLLYLQQLVGARRVAEMDGLREELADTQWDRLLRVQQIRWEHYEPYGSTPRVLARPTSSGYYFPTDLLASVRFLNQAGLQWGDRLLDLGSGAGHVLLAAASVLGLQADGFEVDEELLGESALWVAKAQEDALIRPGQVRVSSENFLTARWPEVDAIYHFPQLGEGGMSPDDLKVLEQRLLRYGAEHPMVRLIMVGRESDEMVVSAFPELLKHWKAHGVGNLGIVILAPTQKDQPQAGMEGVQRMRVEEFERRNQSSLSAKQSERLDHMKRKGARNVTLVPVPVSFPLYIQSAELFRAVRRELQQPDGVTFRLYLLSEVKRWEEMGLILQDAGLDQPIEENPGALPVRRMWISEVASLDPEELLAQILERRLGAPASVRLGQMLVSDGKRTYLAIFDA